MQLQKGVPHLPLPPEPNDNIICMTMPSDLHRHHKYTKNGNLSTIERILIDQSSTSDSDCCQ